MYVPCPRDVPKRRISLATSVWAAIQPSEREKERERESEREREREKEREYRPGLLCPTAFLSTLIPQCAKSRGRSAHADSHGCAEEERERERERECFS